MSSSTSSQPFAGKTALITGGSKGIGAATALELASLGARVIINYASDSQPANELVSTIGSDRAIAIQADVSSVTEIERLVSQSVSWSNGFIDILIPNAAVAPLKSLSQTSESDFDATYALNVKGPYFLVQKCLPYLRPGSHVILLSTSLCNSSTITPNYLLYTSSKGAVEQMTRILAKDLGTKGINVNCVAPGPTATEMFFKGKSEELVQTIASASPFKRLGEPVEIARAMVYLSGQESSWVNGQILRVNGGLTVG